VGRLLRHRLGWSRQRPARRAQEGDEQAIRQWVASDWPRIKNRQARQGRQLLLGRVGRFADSDRALDLGARGKAPVLVHRFNWQRASIAAALCFGADGGGCQLAFHVQP
jgi:hypothetical protein